MDPYVLSSGISAGGGIIGSIINAANGGKRIEQAQQQDYENNLELAKYNNEYNRKLWLEQMEYNSPKNQVERLKEAGLNPNFNSIEGAGNASMPPSSSIPTNLSHRQSVAEVKANLHLQAINQTASLVSQFVKNMSNISGIPNNISFTRRVLGQTLAIDRNLKNSQALRSVLEGLKTLYDDFGYSGNVNIPVEILGNNSVELKRPSGLGIQNLQLRNLNLETQNEIREYEKYLKAFDLNNLKPQELQILQERKNDIARSAGLKGKQLQWFNTVNISKLGASAIAALVMFSKLL